MLGPQGGVLVGRAVTGELATYEDVPIALSVIPDLERAELYCNDAYFDMIGADRARATYADVRLEALYHPDDQAEVYRALGRLTADGDVHAELTVRMRAGELGWRYHAITARVHEARPGATARLVCTFADVDDARRSQLDLEHATGALDLLGSSGEVASFGWEDFDTQSTAIWSDSLFELIGYAPGEIESTAEAFLAHVHPPDVAALQVQLDRAFGQQHALFDHEYRIQPRGSDLRWVRGLGRVYVTDHGRRRFVGLVVNVDERRRAVLNAEEAQRDLERFVYSVSHDFTAPVRHLTYLSEELTEAVADHDSSELKELVSLSRGAADKLGNMVEGLLGYSRLRRLADGVERVDLTALAREVAGVVGRDYPGRILVDELPSVNGNPTLLHRLIYVLIDNAAKFSAGEAEPIVRVYRRSPEEEGGHPVCVVEDNGVGFDEAYAEELFGLFRRLHEETAFEGVGVGLATAARIVRMYSGRIWAKSTPGEGACFFFALPEA